MGPEVQAFFDQTTNTLSYVVRDPQSNACAIIDPVLDFDPASGRASAVSAQAVAAFVEGHGLHADWILETHVHADHLSAAPYLKDRLGTICGRPPMASVFLACGHMSGLCLYGAYVRGP
jgi:glyoxylase-like metal-dependent hydrolase (beta-lactamase superfamily II)